MKLSARLKVHFAVAAGLASLSWFPLAFGQAGDDAADHADLKAREAWRETMHEISAPGEGCFHASYPSTEWEAVNCVPAPGYRSALRRPDRRGASGEQTVGNGYDWVAEAAPGFLLSKAAGSFPTVTGVTSEESVGVAAFGGGGILGPNEYTLQVNTNFYHSAACRTYANCQAWQQYVLSTNTPVSLTSSQLTNDTEVFIEYWLIDYGSSSRSSCPSGFINGGADEEGPGVDCVQNTPAALVATGQIPITDLASLKLSGSAVSGGTDAAVATFGSDAYTATVKDSYTDIASGWNEAEFNVVGNAGGSRADFNNGVSLTVKIGLTEPTKNKPYCLNPSDYDGTTGETNNLTPGKCSSYGGSSPYIQFTESN